MGNGNAQEYSLTGALILLLTPHGERELASLIAMAGDEVDS